MKHKTMTILCAAIWILAAGPPAEAKAKKRAKPALSAASNREAALRQALQFYVYEKGTDVVNDVSGIFDSKAQKITLKCELKNHSAKGIQGVRGVLRFTTIFGEPIADISIESTAAILPGRVMGVTWNVPAERLSPEAFKKLKDTKLDQMKQVWNPTMVVFADGTILK